MFKAKSTTSTGKWGVGHYTFIIMHFSEWHLTIGLSFTLGPPSRYLDLHHTHNVKLMEGGKEYHCEESLWCGEKAFHTLNTYIYIYSIFIELTSIQLYKAPRYVYYHSFTSHRHLIITHIYTHGHLPRMEITYITIQ